MSLGNDCVICRFRFVSVSIYDVTKENIFISLYIISQYYWLLIELALYVENLPLNSKLSL